MGNVAVNRRQGSLWGTTQKMKPLRLGFAEALSVFRCPRRYGHEGGLEKRDLFIPSSTVVVTKKANR